MSRTAIPTKTDTLRSFLAELDDAKTFLRTDRANALGAFNTHSWGDTAKFTIAAVIRQHLRRAQSAMVHTDTCPCTDCT